MLSSPIGRLRFFLYSLAISIAELIAVALCVAATMGFDGLVHSKPGPPREGLALASFVVMMAFVVPRTNITWRRRADADLSKWLVVPYIVFVALFAALQAATLWLYDFKTGARDGSLAPLEVWLETDDILLVGEEKGEGGGEDGGVFELGGVVGGDAGLAFGAGFCGVFFAFLLGFGIGAGVGAGEAHGAGGVEADGGAEVGFLFILLDVVAV